MRDFEFPPYAMPVSENFGDPYLPSGCNDSDDYFDMEDSDGSPHTFTQPVARPKPSVDALLSEIESRMPDDVLELFEQRKKEVA